MRGHPCPALGRRVLRLAVCVCCALASGAQDPATPLASSAVRHAYSYTVAVDPAAPLRHTGSHFLGLALGSWDKLAQGPNHHLRGRGRTPAAGSGLAPPPRARTSAGHVLHPSKSTASAHGPRGYGSWPRSACGCPG